jgi:hypothetical protein
MEGTKGVNPIFSKFHKVIIKFYKFHCSWKTKEYKGLEENKEVLRGYKRKFAIILS